MTDTQRGDSTPAAALGTNTDSDTPQISLRSLRKTFGSVVAVDSVDLDVADGEFFAMLGPSGSGKTTVLRMIAGFETPTSGQVILDGRDATALPPFRRDVNTVFQDYALFPHMTVQQNVEYGLRVHGVAAQERRRRAGEALDMVRLGEHGARKPTQLSGGQRQRVALARALVNRPRVLLLDEPLGALDLKLREQMQLELKSIQREVGITFVFVTHDQDEALTLCDRLAVFNNGRIEQLGGAQEVYEHPATQFVAGFVGSSNVISGEAARAVLGRDGAFAVRPEKIAVVPRESAAAGPGEVTVAGVVQDVVYAGSITRVVVAGPAGLTLSATLLNSEPTDTAVVRRADHVTLRWHESAMRSIAASAATPAPTDHS
ncbi:ABC transporter ATP-binding protein [Galbitalea soli]|uniref:ABC transporter ATP-binding protein n=1 Tax=Galbitalea soli TaxID=1268042 RepID=A0A7C9TT21_9MICO|nr:ABC transporter ATP-binding protein [Galbitalea soli]NEM91843.1 ABC transporter ATP-binding protein [Galbitalea soli]NYJ29323.1 putative spermidine/putrescine transport system ATP-binding protein [Galbitalea soli]